MGHFTVKGANKHFIRLIAFHYAAYTYTTFYSIGKKFNLNEHTVSELLFRGIAEDIINDSVADRIFTKVVSSYKSGRKLRADRWQRAFDLRTEKRYMEKMEKQEAQRKCDDEVAALEFQISSYDDYFIQEEGAPTKEELIAKLTSLKASTF